MTTENATAGFGQIGLVVCLIVPLLCGSGVASAGQVKARTPPRPLSPVSWTCPMHPEVVDNKGGPCPICKMNLVPVRLALVWTCPIHPDVTANDPGTCKICARDLVRVIKALSWTCPVHSRVDELNPGVCPICKRALVAKYSLRPHGDHNPKHGGLFFMAPNNWHIEGTHPSASIFRLYVYDEYSKPFIPATFSGRIAQAALANQGRGQVSEVSVPFKRVGQRPYLEARLPQLGLPATIAVKVRFTTGDQEDRFDFLFLEYSKELAGRAPVQTRK